MSAAVIRIGDLNRRLVLEAPDESDDGAGGVTRLYDVVTTLWAQVIPQPAHPGVAADASGATARVRIVIRKRDGLTTRHRLIDGTRTWRITAIAESADRRFLALDGDLHED